MHTSRTPCPCPKCKHQVTRVIRSKESQYGEVVRRRCCPECDYRWYTAQQPEYILKEGDLVFWNKANGPVLKEWADAA